MTREKIVVLGIVVVFLLAACATMPPTMKDKAAKPDSGEIVSSILTGVEDAREKIIPPPAPPAPPEAITEEAAPPEEQPPQIEAASSKRKAAPKAPLTSFKKQFKLARIPPKKAVPKKNGGFVITAKATAPEVAKPPMPIAAETEPENGVMAEVMRAPAAANGEEEYAVSMADRWNAFLQSFKDAVYTFNPSSPIKVDKPRTIHLWVDTMVDQQTLAEELRRIVPWDAARIEAGAIRVSPEMKAILTGENFKIKANSPEKQIINMAGRTIWSWDITPTWPGLQTLHLRLIAIPSDAISSSYTIPVPLDRTIEVKVTIWWLIDHFFEKYWKWVLGGLGTLFITILGWWWKKRFGQQR